MIWPLSLARWRAPLWLLVLVSTIAVFPTLLAAMFVNTGWLCVARHAADGTQPGTCAKWFAQTLSAQPSSREAHDGLAFVAQASGDFEGVLRHSDLGSRSPANHLRRGIALDALSRKAEAVLTWKAVNAQRYFFWQGRRHEEGGAVDHAIASYERALSIDPDASDPFWTQGADYRFLGFLVRAYLVVGRPADAMRVAADWSARPEAPGEAFFLLGLSELTLGHYEASGRAFREAASRDSLNWAFESGWWLGQALEGLGDLDGAARAYEAVDQIVPSPRTAHSIGALWMRRRENQRAITEFRRAIALDPSHHPSYLPLALLLRDQGQLKEARLLVVDALRRWPDDVPLLGELRALANQEKEMQSWR